jgi:predicted PurR-regulated permease PerM
MARETERLIAYQRTVAILMVVAVLAVSFFIVRPFLIAILSAAALAFIFYPLYKKIFGLIPRRFPRQVVASMLTCLIIILIVMIPVIFVMFMLTREVRDGYFFLQQFLTAPGFTLDLPPQIVHQLGDFSQFKEPIATIAGSVISWIQGILRAIPNAALNIFITIFSTYYFLKHAQEIYKFLHDFLPLPAGKYEKIFARFDDLSRGVILGQVVVGSLQGVLAWLGFALVGIPNPVLWGFLTAIVSTIPLLGAVLVWFPIFLYLAIKGLYIGIWWKAIFLFLYGTFVISFIDNLIKPKIVGDHAKVHPLIVLFGILGGIQLFGIAGVLIGPLVLTIFDIVIETYQEIL